MQSPLLKSTLLALGCIALGCDDENEPMAMDASQPALDANLGTPLQPDAGAQGDGAVPAQKTPLVIVSQRETQDESLNYLHVLPDFPADRKLDLRDAIELGTAAVARAGDGAVWVYQPDGAFMQKYLVDAQLGVRPDTRLSFAAYGISGYDPDTVWVSPDRAFLVDESTAQIILWNPRTMTVVSSTPIDPSILTNNGLKVQLQSDAVVSGGRAWIAVNWRDWDTFDHVPGAALAWFDTALDAPTLQIIHEDRCAASVDAPFLDEAGNVYIMGDAALGFDVIASPKMSGKPQCARRVLAGQTQFDPDYFVDVQAATGSPGFHDSHPMGMGKILLNLWAPSLKVADYAKPSPMWYWALQTTFEYMILDTNSKIATPVAGLPRAAAQFSTTLRVDGQNYVQSYRTDNGAVLSRVGTDGNVVEVLELGAGADVQYLGRL
jgi:hypothetical protein